MIMRIVRIAIVGLLCVVALGAEPLQKGGGTNPAVRSANHARQMRPASTCDQEALEELTHRVRKIELQALQKSEPPKDRGPYIAAAATIIVAIIAAAATIIVAIIAWIGERKRAASSAQRALELARAEALWRQQEKHLDFHVKQMERFYAPMRALLTQTKALRDKMRLELIQDEPQRYRFSSNPAPGAGDFEVRQSDGTWEDFRLLDQFPAVKKNPKALVLADRMLAIGKRMTEIISQNAGLASGDLIDLLGQYMAHYAILSAIREEKKDEPYPPGSHEMGYYPRELDTKIAAEYRQIAQVIADSAKESRRLTAVIADQRSSKQP